VRRDKRACRTYDRLSFFDEKRPEDLENLENLENLEYLENQKKNNHKIKKLDL